MHLYYLPVINSVQLYDRGCKLWSPNLGQPLSQKNNAELSKRRPFECGQVVWTIFHSTNIGNPYISEMVYASVDHTKPCSTPCHRNQFRHPTAHDHIEHYTGSSTPNPPLNFAVTKSAQTLQRTERAAAHFKQTLIPSIVENCEARATKIEPPASNICEQSVVLHPHNRPRHPNVR